MINFALAVFFLIITPGPGVLSVAGVGAAFGYKSGVRYILGLCLGTNLVALAVVTGLAAIVLSNSFLRVALMLCSSSYLLFLAYRIATQGADISFSKSDRKPGILAGILLQLVNPKAYAVNTAMYTAFLIYPNSIILEIGIKFVIMNLIWFPIHLFWLFLGVYLKSLNLSSRHQSNVNLLMACALVIVVILAVFSSF
jgi:threonine/homoserine/homoserine lactone efflux protein